MMKKLRLTIFILLTVQVLTNAQTKNVDLDNLRYSITYRSMPKQPFNPLFFTYFVVMNTTKTTEQRISVADIEDAVYIEGQQKVGNSENADLSLLVNLGNLVVQSSDIIERKSERKNKEGEVISVSYYYTLVVNYTFESSYQVIQGDQALPENVVYNPRFSIKFKSEEYGSRRDAANFWENNRAILISDFTAEAARQTAATATARVSSLYGFPITKTTDVLQTMDEKKHAENEPFRAACASLESKLETVTPNRGLNRNELEGVIEYFKSIPAKYPDPKLKADVKLRYAAYFNLCQLYLYSEDFENVYKYADLLIQNDHDRKDGEKFKKKADEWKEMISRTVVRTRYFNPEDYWTE